MIIAVDVQYNHDTATAGGIAFEHWASECEHATYRSNISEVHDYIPGEFYRRELPCILRLFEEHSLQPDIVVVDGFVYLDGLTKPGLGWHLFDALGGETPVVGVAKTKFAGTPEGLEIYRGKSMTPLYVTSVGFPLETAKDFIRSMYGQYRIPSMLKRADQIARGTEQCIIKK